MPEGKWAFDESVTAVFDEMLARSIPNLQGMRWATNEMAAQFMDDEWSHVIDLGASRGESVDALIQRHKRQTYHLIEVSKPMLEVLQARYAGNTDVFTYGHDLRENQSVLNKCMNRSCLVISVLTLMFIPIEYRQMLLDEIYAALEPGGALLLVEKMLGNSNATNTLFNDAYYRMKATNGYSQEEITRKRLSLEGVLVPLPERMHVEMLKEAGFSRVECYWRTLQFAGFVAVK